MVPELLTDTSKNVPIPLLKDSNKKNDSISFRTKDPKEYLIYKVIFHQPTTDPEEVERLCERLKESSNDPKALREVIKSMIPERGGMKEPVAPRLITSLVVLAGSVAAAERAGAKLSLNELRSVFALAAERLAEVPDEEIKRRVDATKALVSTIERIDEKVLEEAFKGIKSNTSVITFRPPRLITPDGKRLRLGATIKAVVSAAEEGWKRKRGMLSEVTKTSLRAMWQEVEVDNEVMEKVSELINKDIFSETVYELLTKAFAAVYRALEPS